MRRGKVLVFVLLCGLLGCTRGIPRATFYPDRCAVRIIDAGFQIHLIEATHEAGHHEFSAPSWPEAGHISEVNVCQLLKEAGIDTIPQTSVELWVGRPDAPPGEFIALHLELYPQVWEEDSVALLPTFVE